MPEPRIATDTPTPRAVDIGPVRVLVLDDQRFDRHRIARLCSGMDMVMELSNADTLKTFSEQLKTERFDLIFLDYALPDGDGMQALEMLRLDALNCNAAVIMVVGEGREGLADQALRAGCSDYILKDNLSPAAFRRATNNALQKSLLSIGMDRHARKRTETEETLRRFSTECARDIKPMVSRMMRQLRALRDPDALSHDDWLQRRDGIEASCMRLWEFLVDLENYSGDDLALSADAGDPDGTASHPGKTAKPRKSPSLFGRVTH